MSAPRQQQQQNEEAEEYVRPIMANPIKMMRWRFENVQPQHGAADEMKMKILINRQQERFIECSSGEIIRQEYQDNIIRFEDLEDYSTKFGNCMSCFSTGPYGWYCSRCFQLEKQINNWQGDDWRLPRQATCRFVLYMTENQNVWKPEKLEEAMNQTPDYYPLKKGRTLDKDGNIVPNMPVYLNQSPLVHAREWEYCYMDWANHDPKIFFDPRSTAAGEMFWITHFQY